MYRQKRTQKGITSPCCFSTNNFKPRKHCQVSTAGILTCNIFTALPIFIVKTVGNAGKNFNVTYSCATVRDLHTIPS